MASISADLISADLVPSVDRAAEAVAVVKYSAAEALAVAEYYHPTIGISAFMAVMIVIVLVLITVVVIQKFNEQGLRQKLTAAREANEKARQELKKANIALEGARQENTFLKRLRDTILLTEPVVPEEPPQDSTCTDTATFTALIGVVVVVLWRVLVRC